MKNRFRIYLTLAILYALFIFYLSSRSSFGDTRAIFDFIHMENLRSLLKFIEGNNLEFLLYPLYFFSNYFDKIAHTVLYSGFGLLLYLTLKHSSNTEFKNNAFLIAIIIGTLYGVTDEFHQTFVPGRTASGLDLLADGIGVTVAQGIVFIKERLYFRSKDSSIG